MKQGLCLILLLQAWLLAAQSTFIKSYDTPNETIYNVRTVKTVDNTDYIFLALEGYNHISNTFFTRIQTINGMGELQSDFAHAYIGEPLHLSSGVFETKIMGMPQIITPEIYDTLNGKFLKLKVHRGYPNQNYTYYSHAFLPDTLQSILAFPTSITHSYTPVFSTYYYWAAGKGFINGLPRTFAFKFDEYANYFQMSQTPVIVFPDMQQISSLIKTDEGLLAIGQSNGWTGRVLLMNDANQELWNQDFTDGADAAQVPYFCAPLMASNQDAYPQDSLKIVISYQNKARQLFLSYYAGHNLHEITHIDLDGYIGAAPLSVSTNSVAVGYVHQGKQILAQYDFSGNLIWKRILPGVGNLGRESLLNKSYFPYNPSFYYISGRLATGGFYLAKIRAADGFVEADYVTEPDAFTCSVYPNPSQEITKLYFDLKAASAVSANLYNIKGQWVKTILTNNYPAGKYHLEWMAVDSRGQPLPTGVYLLRITAGTQTKTLKLLHYGQDKIVFPPHYKR